MRIVYLANARMPTEKAHGFQIMKTCEGFAAAGAEVFLLVPQRANSIKQEVFGYYGMLPSFTIRRTAVWDTVRFGRLGFALESLTYALTGAWSVLRDFRRETLCFGRSPAVLALLGTLGYKSIYELHDYTPGLRRFLRIFKGCYAGFVTTNTWKKERLIKDLEISPDKIHVAPNGVELVDFDRPTDREAYRLKMGIGPREKAVIYLGRFYGWKGVHVFVQTAASLPSGVKAVFIGGTRQAAKDLAGLDPSANCVFIPDVPHAESADYLRAADELVLPNSAQSQESVFATSPIKLFEYMASGVPIVASDLPSIREIVSDETAYFFRPDDAEDLARKIESVLSDPEAAVKAERARRKSRSYSWKSRSAGIMQWLRAVDLCQ